MARPVETGTEQQFQGLDAKELLEATVLPGLLENPNAVALVVKLLQYNDNRFHEGTGSPIKSAIGTAAGERLVQVATMEEEQQDHHVSSVSSNDSRSKGGDAVWRAFDECITNVEAVLPAEEFQTHIVEPLLAHFAAQDTLTPEASLVNAKLLATHSTTPAQRGQAMDAIVDSFLDNPTDDGVVHAAQLLARVAVQSQENPKLFEEVCRNLLAIASPASEKLLVNTINQLSAQNYLFSTELELDSAPLKVVACLLGAESGHCLVVPAVACDFLAGQFQLINGQNRTDLARCCQPVIESLLEKDEKSVASGMRLLSSFAAWYMKSLRATDVTQKSRLMTVAIV